MGLSWTYFLATEEVIKIAAARLTVRHVSRAIGLATAGCEMSGGCAGSPGVGVSSLRPWAGGEEEVTDGGQAGKPWA